jgi:Glycosyl hydrolase family 3 N terminal domain
VDNSLLAPPGDTILLLPLACALGQDACLNPKLPVDRRVNDPVSRMTLEEKASQVVQLAAPIPRLKVPACNWWIEALHGVASGGVATVFPEPIALGATWDAPLIHDMATAIGTKARARHNEDMREGNFQGIGLDFFDRVVAPGEYRISVGGGQPGTGVPVTEARFATAGASLPE